MFHIRLDYFMMEEYVRIVNPGSEVFLPLIPFGPGPPRRKYATPHVFIRENGEENVSHTHGVCLEWKCV